MKFVIRHTTVAYTQTNNVNKQHKS